MKDNRFTGQRWCQHEAATGAHRPLPPETAPRLSPSPPSRLSPLLELPEAHSRFRWLSFHLGVFKETLGKCSVYSHWVRSLELFCLAQLALYLCQTRLPAHHPLWPSWPPFCCGAFWESDSCRRITYQHSSLMPGFLPASLPVSLTPPQFTHVAACDRTSSSKGEWFCSCTPTYLSEDVWLHLSLGSCEQRRCDQVRAGLCFQFVSIHTVKWFLSHFSLLFFPLRVEASC